MPSPIIKVENISKAYVINHETQERYTSLRDVMSKKAKKIFSFPKGLQPAKQLTNKEEFWALKDLNFEIHPGDRVGIIGRNGAGKSTLLKILSRITEPTSGKITINGRVASLLEVGTGFHPELTGRENIYLNGAILGMSRREIKAKFDEIVDFAEVEKFLDTPVKRYSSGMYVRLAFAVAAHLEPEILIVDEVLAVGDAQFQKKCLGKMEDVGKSGRTVLFVSHNMGSILQLCKKGVYLNSGSLEMVGEIKKVINSYINNSKNEKLFYSAEQSAKIIYLQECKLRNETGFKNEFLSNEKLIVAAEIEIKKTLPSVLMSFTLQSNTGQYLSTFVEKLSELPIKNGKSKIEINFDCTILATGNYYIRFAFFDNTSGFVFDLQEMICPFKITDNGTNMAQFESLDYGFFNLNYKISEQ